MSKVLTPTASYDLITIPTNGDSAEQGGIEPGFQELTDHDAWLLGKIAPTSLTQPVIAVAFSAGGEWTVTATNSTQVGGPSCSGTSASERVFLELTQLISGSVITQIDVGIRNDDGPHTGVPAVPCQAQLYIVDNTTGIMSAVGSAADDPGTVAGDFDVFREIQVVGLSQTIDRSRYRYLVRVQSESGSNSVLGTKIACVTVTQTAPTS